MQHRHVVYAAIVMLLVTVLALPVVAIGEQTVDIPPATIVNDEGGPVVITGEVAYTNAFFTLGTSEPVVILEDQTGFVTRDRGYVLPIASQVLGQITSDFRVSPFTYSLALPLEPQAPLNDVDFDGEADTGVMIFQVAYWTNTFGDVYLEERDLFGGGWSGAYTSALVDNSVDNQGEYYGGKILIYAPVADEAFPSGFGADNKLFTADDPLVTVPQGFTLVDLDTDPFTFDRSREIRVDLLEGEGAAADDFSELSFTEAYAAMVDKFRTDYAFTEYYNLDWDALEAEYLPRVQEVEANEDADGYALVLRDFLYNIPDGHIAIPFVLPLVEEFQTRTDGGLGIAIRKLDDERVIVNYLVEGSPADIAGMQLGTEILSIQGVPILDWVAQARPALNHPENHVKELQQLRYASRFPLGTVVDVTFRNPDETETQSVSLEVVPERESFSFSSFNRDVSPTRLPVEHRILPSGYMYTAINSFSDDERLTIQLWERMIQDALSNEVPGIIVDMRSNGGGNGFLADQMAAYFFNEVLELGNSGRYDEDRGEFYFNPDTVQEFILPPENLRFNGPVAVLVGPNCASACEGFTWDMTLQDRAAIVGQYPTQGLGGSVTQFFMPAGLRIQITIGRTVDMNGEINIEGIGVPPTVQVPVTEETLFADFDVVLQAAVDHLNSIASGQSDG